MGKQYVVEESELPSSKLCSKCAVVKMRAAFVRSKSHKDGLYPWCAECRSLNRKTPKVRAYAVAKSRQWRVDNPEKMRANNRKYLPIWRANNPERFNVLKRKSKENRRARLNNVVNDLTAAQWRDILEMFNHACVYCGADDVRLEQDHIQPISRGGAHTFTNVVPACTSCNRHKSVKPLSIFLADQPNHPLLALAA